MKMEKPFETRAFLKIPVSARKNPGLANFPLKRVGLTEDLT